MTVQPLSLSALGDATGNGGSTLAAGQAVAVSQNGRFVVLQSTATNLVTGQVDGNAASDVFLYDRDLATTTLVSRSNTDPLTAGDGASSNATISADGRYVAFHSTATNLVAGQNDPNGKADVFLYDRVAGTVTLVSRSSADPLSTANESSSGPVISADGNFVVFTSAATNLVAGQADTNAALDVFLYDRAAGTNTLVSRNSASPTSTGSGSSDNPSASADGRYIAFRSMATDLVGGLTDENGNADVFVYDRVTGTTTLVSRNSDSPTTTASAMSDSPVLSADGSSIVFASYASDLVSGVTDLNSSLDVFVYDRAAGTNALVTHSAADLLTAGDNFSDSPVVSGNGRYIAFRSAASDLMTGQTDANGDIDVFLHDRVTGATTLVSRSAASSTTSGNLFSDAPAISADGRLVAFTSVATNLVSGISDTNATLDVFVYDHAVGTVRLASHSSTSAAEAGNGLSERPSLSANGSLLLFQSGASNLVAGDSNGFVDAFAFIVMNAPMLTADGVLPAVNEDDVGPSGATIAGLFAGLFTDSDPGSSFVGVVVVGNAADPVTEGTWQYSTNGGGGWFDIGQVDNGATALALSADTLIRFLPVARYHGTPGSIAVRALDDSYSGAFTTTAGSIENRVHLDPGGSAAVFGNARSVHTAVTAVNDNPVARHDAATVAEDGSVTMDVLANDTDVDGDPLSVASFTDGSYGTVTRAADGRLVYTPKPNFNGTDRFSYTVSDGNGGTATANVTITVNPDNDAPVNKVPSTRVMYRNGSLPLSLAVNDQDAGDSPLALTVKASTGRIYVASYSGLTSATGYGTATLTLTGPLTALNAALARLTYKPNPGFVGYARIYLISNDRGNDGTLPARTDTDSFLVRVINRKPVRTRAIAYTTRVNRALYVSASVGLLRSFRDYDGDRLTAQLVRRPAVGTLRFSTSGGFSYVPPRNFKGKVTFVVRAFDGNLYSDLAIVTLTIF